MKLNPIKTIIAVSMLSGLTLAQTSLTLPVAIQTALSQSPEIKTQTATTANTQKDLATKSADPTTLIFPLTQAQQAVALEGLKLKQKRIEISSDVASAFFVVQESQLALDLKRAQLELDKRNLDIAKAKLADKNTTALEVQRVRNTVASSTRSAKDAVAQLAIQNLRLKNLLGQTTKNTLNVSPQLPVITNRCAALPLSDSLNKQIPALFQLSQMVELNELNVRLSNNDYTPATLLRDNTVALENARLNASNQHQNFLVALSDAERAVGDAEEALAVAQEDFDNQKITLTQDQARYKSGAISLISLKQTELEMLRQTLALKQTQDAYYRSIFNLSNASGTDCTGLVGAQ